MSLSPDSLTDTHPKGAQHFTTFNPHNQEFLRSKPSGRGKNTVTLAACLRGEGGGGKSAMKDAVDSMEG